jgi:hypothetical protein
MVVLSCSATASGNDCQPWNAVSQAAVRCAVSISSCYVSTSSYALRGNGISDALRRRVDFWFVVQCRRGASKRCVPTRSVGTSRDFKFRRR